MQQCISTVAARAGLGVMLGLLCVVLSTASPAAAQSACQGGSGEVFVEFLGTGTSNTILMAQIDGESYQGEIRVRVYCGVDGQLVPNSTVTFTTTVPSDSLFNPATNTWITLNGPVPVTLPTGELVIKVKTNQPNLLGTNWKALVGTNTVTLTGAFGQALPGNEYPTATGMNSGASHSLVPARQAWGGMR
jgi:hypothetical protein